jgi:hypothetical protein
MNRSKGVFLLILFIGFSFLGFLMWNEVKGLFSTTNTSTTPSSPGTSNQQQNFLIVHIDDLTSDEPRLVSVWGFFFYPSESPSLTLRELYPIPDQEQEEIKSLFAIDSNGELNNRFVKKLNSYQISWSGIMIVDHQAVASINDWLQIENTPVSLQQAIEIPGAMVQPEDEITWFTQVCTQLQTLNLATNPHLPWSTIIPEHMHTTIIFDNLVTVWDDLASAKIPPHCEAISP